MYSEIECGVCYRSYNTGQRCPRELQCQHSFCESCLLALARPMESDGEPRGPDCSIICPLCRHTTSISMERTVGTELPVDETVMERLQAVAVVDQEEDDEPETPGEESDSFTGTRGGKLRRSWRKVWRKISGRSSQQRGKESKYEETSSF